MGIESTEHMDNEEILKEIKTKIPIILRNRYVKLLGSIRWKEFVDCNKGNIESNV